MRGPAFLAAFAVILSTAAVVLLVAPTTQAKEFRFVVEMRQTSFSPSFFRVEIGDNVTFVVYNNDSFDHTFDLPDFAISSGRFVGPNPWTSPSFTPTQNGTFWFHCSVEGHASRRADGSWTGMAGILQVGEPVGTPGPDLTPILAVGTIVLAVTIAGIVYATRRKPVEKK